MRLSLSSIGTGSGVFGNLKRGHGRGTFQVYIFKSVQFLAYFFTLKLVHFYLQRGRAQAHAPPGHPPPLNMLMGTGRGAVMLCGWEGNHIGLAFHWPRVTDLVVYPPTGSMANVREISTLPTPQGMPLPPPLFTTKQNIALTVVTEKPHLMNHDVTTLFARYSIRKLSQQ